MIDFFIQKTLEATEADDLYLIEDIQQLWSGYGIISRYGLQNSEHHSVVIKNIRYPDEKHHPRGWGTDFSHQRKVKSYHVEMNWYKNFSHLCDEFCRIPHCLAMETQGEQVVLVLEDLNDAGFPIHKTSVNWQDIESCIKWLANFHATFIQEKPKGLWKTGTYWHLETRPDELQVLSDRKLKKAASKIDQVLKDCKYQTFVHGDAKLANFCFGSEGKVAAVDFQYVGGGVGVKDLAYFIGSCLYEDDCERLESELLDCYFEELKAAIKRLNKAIDSEDLEKEWRKMFPYAWADFHRFLKGWSPGHWKINSYSEKVTQKVITNL